MIPGHHRSAADRPAPRATPIQPTAGLRPRHNIDPPQFHGRGFGLAIPLSLALYALAIAAALHLAASVWP